MSKGTITVSFKLEDIPMIIETVEKLQQENKELKEQLDKYENPEDMTLMYMWCTEKVKDENTKLKDKLKKIQNLVNKFIKDSYIKGDSQLNLSELLEILEGDNK